METETMDTTQVIFHCSVPYCECSFSDSFSLAEHLKKHAGEKQHICPVRTCGRRFSTPGNLSRHKRLHGLVKPLECPVAGCICTFRSENKLSKHMKFHLGGPVHVCPSPACGKTFSTAGNLNRHIKGHHRELDTRKSRPRARNLMLLSRSDLSLGSPTGSDEFLPTVFMMSQIRLPVSPTSSESTVDSMFDMTPPSPTDTLSCASSPTASSTPSWISLDSPELDELVSILDEAVKVEDVRVEPTNVQTKADRPSVLDDMIRFHIDHMY
ncbi:hypothetical protein PsorP6_005675 [Peronosclerospora sorghi]|uniref:Uncharacterized protein n=1 Tax=Peronosclerospora sorghi TaxID=230839 RepID=A0ACC0W6P1_9STRA|nr:hypothetical protein PsorP6_005675 [Peronosclerospora sorghi]